MKSWKHCGPFFKGDMARWTGKREDGFCELEILEGHRKGEKVWQDPTHWLYRGTSAPTAAS